MKTIRLIIAGLVMTMGFSSCSSLFYDAKVDVLNSIQKGMSMDGYIAKPFEMKVLFARVDNLIRSFKMS